jgi:hypothetical protein
MSPSKTTKKPSPHALTSWRCISFGGGSALLIGLFLIVPVASIFSDLAATVTAVTLFACGCMGFGIGHSEGEKYGKEDWDEDERTVELIAHNFNLENMLAVHTAALPDWAELGDYRSMEAYALREQKAENREQKARNAKLTAENTRLKKKLATLRT